MFFLVALGLSNSYITGRSTDVSKVLCMQELVREKPIKATIISMLHNEIQGINVLHPSGNNDNF